MAVSYYQKPKEHWGYEHVTSAYKEEQLLSAECIFTRARELFPSGRACCGPPESFEIRNYYMSEAFVKIDLHGLRQEEAIKVIDQAIASADSATYHLQLIHGYNRGTSLRSMIYEWYKYDSKVKRIMLGDNPGITILVLKELY